MSLLLNDGKQPIFYTYNQCRYLISKGVKYKKKYISSTMNKKYLFFK